VLQCYEIIPQGLKPATSLVFGGTDKSVPFQNSIYAASFSVAAEKMACRPGKKHSLRFGQM
jgi:hypothetical protein